MVVAQPLKPPPLLKQVCWWDGDCCHVIDMLRLKIQRVGGVIIFSLAS